MHVAADLNWFLQFIVLAFSGALGLLYLIRNTASRYFVVDPNFDSSAADYSSLDSRKRENMAKTGESFDSCAVCGLLTTKQCGGCKMVKYCSQACQTSHWNSEHKKKCNDLQSSYKANLKRPTSALRRRNTSVVLGGSSNKMLFPYEEFVKFFNWNKSGYPPCGLLNCGNSCFANVVLQCLTYSRPLVAYLLEKGHRIECKRDDWCFLCEFQRHVERASRSLNPFSPINILSRLPNIGGNLGYGKQEDAHEFMRFAIDTMQSVCLDEFGGEKAVHPSYQETTLIQHIFGGRLQSQVICAECNNVSDQFENIMDLTVEIHGDAGSLEECLDQFTAKEWLHGDNMYKCDSCNAYVMAWKRLTIQRAPNILTIALKRFQSGRFGKLNKRVTFPEILDLRPYMSESEDGNDIYKLYGVIVHVNMLNASYFGHYICYIKDFCGNWYRIDDCKVASIGLDEVLSQGAYMLLYSRIRARRSCLLPSELLKNEESANVKINEIDPSPKEPTEPFSDAEVCLDGSVNTEQSLSESDPVLKVDSREELFLSFTTTDTEDANGDIKMVSSDLISPTVNDMEIDNTEKLLNPTNIFSSDKISTRSDSKNSKSSSSSVSHVENAICGSENEVRDETGSANSASMPEDIVGQGNDFLSSDDNPSFVKGSGDAGPAPKCKPLFAPGFLEKRPRKKSIESEDQVPAELMKLERGSRLLCENGNGGLLDERKPDFVHNKPFFAPGFLEKRPRKKYVKSEDKVPAELVNLGPESSFSDKEKP